VPAAETFTAQHPVLLMEQERVERVRDTLRRAERSLSHVRAELKRSVQDASRADMALRVLGVQEPLAALAGQERAVAVTAYDGDDAECGAAAYLVQKHGCRVCKRRDGWASVSEERVHPRGAAKFVQCDGCGVSVPLTARLFALENGLTDVKRWRGGEWSVVEGSEIGDGEGLTSASLVGPEWRLHFPERAPHKGR